MAFLSTPEPIAIVGAGCRFSGDSSRPSKLWELLKQPQDVASGIPSDRFNLKAFYHPEGTHHGSTNVLESYFIAEGDIRHFDAPFFNTPNTEADPMDPQHRQLLEVVYESLEDAGITIEEKQGSDTAVFVGLMCNDYSAISSRDFDYIPTYGATGIAASNASSRVSYFFDWHGACMTIDTACSSSLIALHQAVQALRNGTSKMAIAAGTNLILDPLPYVSESNLNMLSPKGRSRMWDSGADGYARGDGVAAVVLKTLSQAIADGDTIDCIIRETGANQDGRTKGITMPSGVAQASLIRDTYSRACLDPLNPQERCQYFEAHGTGTPAGDPQEASALHAAFFDNREDRREDDILYVGSVKTVIGHTEGTAGLAGLLKAYLAIKNRTLPPNLHFEKLSSGVEPFYTNLQIITKAQPWPDLPAGVPRRASVNSFGFGGSNAHAILESYDQATNPTADFPRGSLSLIPFVFSAASETSLRAKLKSYANYLENNPTVDLDNLRYTLASKRSILATKTAFTALSVKELVAAINSRLENSASALGTTYASSQSILGIFTGQGAQWPQMGSQLISAYPSARKTIQELDESLSNLAEKPTWTLAEQLSADASSSRIEEAAISQPLCTAVQIMVVNLLREGGVTFQAVVGHSSGEIAAAYAAGLVSASDAIRIAYCRGLYAKLACGTEGNKGAMLAVATSLEDAQELCDLEDFEGRLNVAASNSSSSVTISGDADAIEEAKLALEGEEKWTRLLRVDTAYHSHHMKPCSIPYLEALRACKITVLEPPAGAPTWFSSVTPGRIMTVECEDLAAQYWVDNMANTVLFSQALQSALQASPPFNLGVEVGPHPALKGPATQTIQEASGSPIVYTGTLSRNKSDVVALADSLGSIWASLGSGINWKNLQVAYCQNTTASLIKGLPLYDWSHEKIHWAESRWGRLFRTQDSAIHNLLGQRIPDGTAQEIRWKNILKPREISWLPDHALQGQIVFPGTGYMCLAMEASMELAAGRAVQAIELTNLEILKAIAIDEMIGTEIVVSMTKVAESEQDGAEVIEARFMSYSTVSREATDLVLNACGDIRVILGEHLDDYLSPRDQYQGQMADVDVEEFYEAMGELGYGYSGPFKGLSSIQRRLGYASGTITRPDSQDPSRPLLFHPGMLDTALQTLFAAFSAPGDARLWALHVPTGIRRVTLVPSLCGGAMPEQVSFDSRITASRPNHITGDVDIIAADGLHKCIEIDGLGFVPFTAATAADDRNLFSKTTWGVGKPDGEAAMEGTRATAEENRKASDMERTALFYLRRLTERIPPEQRGEHLAAHHRALLDMAEYQKTRFGKNARKNMWLADQQSVINEILARYEDTDADFAIMKAVGENLVEVINGDVTILEVMTRDGKLDAFYDQALGYPLANRSIAVMVSQVAYRFPHMDILEVGAGTGGATRGILKELGTAFASYTYTDISTGFFEKAREEFRQYAGRMVFKTLDISKDTAPQGYEDASYDMVLASNVLHATEPLEATLRNARRLLRPGGYLILLEIVDPEAIAVGLTMGGLPGWWVGVDEGRKIAPTMTLNKWNLTLRKCGFSGIDTHTPLKDPQTFITSVFAAQAVDEQVNLYRRPMASKPDQIAIKDLILIGGESIDTLGIMEDLQGMLGYRAESTTVVSNFDELPQVPAGASILSLADIDSPTFKDLNEEKWVALKSLIADASVVLWVAHGSHCDEPFNGAMLGLWRSIPYEVQQLRSQFLEVENLRDLSSNMLAEQFLRLHIGSQWLSSPTALNILWKPEPELKLVDGVLQIQRVMVDTEANARYNSAKRTLTEDVNPEESNVTLEYIAEDDRYALHKVRTPIADLTKPHVEIIADYSLLLATRTSAGLAYLSLGTRMDDGTPVLAVSGTNSSRFAVPESSTLPVPASIEKSRAIYLRIAGYFLYCEQIRVRLHSGSSLLVHEPDDMLASMLGALLEGTGSTVIFTTSDTTKAGRKAWVVLHPAITRRCLLATLPTSVDLFFDLSNSCQVSSLGNRISSALPSFCERASANNLVAKNSLPLVGDAVNKVAKMMRDLGGFLESQSALDLINAAADVQTLGAGEVTVQDAADIFKIVDWHSEGTLPVVREPVDWRKDIFRDGKTYWLIGLAGDLGRSLVDWMIAHGATSVVVSSRNPQVPDWWINMCAAQGARVRSIAGDVSDMASLRRMHEEIEATMSPIAGVANGALVLRDKIFINTSYDELQAVLKPKVEGTANLDELFSEDSLDWFVAFSSIIATTGNTGQSAYGAANCFMKALMQQRRAKGLAGSAIDISRVHGVGYVERETKTGRVLTQREIGKIHRVTMAMSESDLHQLFAEAILSGKPGSGRDGDIITGIRTLSGEITDVYWAANAKFGHFIQTVGSSDATKNAKASDRIDVKAQLETAKTLMEATAIIQTAFVGKLCLSLQTEQTHISVTTPLVDFGMDSLVAVEIRTWFQVQLGVDMPVLKVLGGASVVDLVEDAVDRLPQKLRASFEEASGQASISITVENQSPSSSSSDTASTPQVSASEAGDQEGLKIAKEVNTPNTELATPMSVSGDTYFHAKSLPSDRNDGVVITKVEEKSDGATAEFPVFRHFQPEIIRTEPLSYTQARFWVLRQCLDDPTTSNITFFFRMTGHFEVAKLAKTLDMIVNRHEALRTCFFSGQDSIPHQGIMKSSAIQLEHFKVKSLDQVRRMYHTLSAHSYDLEKGDTLRVALCGLSSQVSYMIVGYHHIAMDGTSWEVLFGELQRGYMQGFLPSVRRHYSVWASKQREDVVQGRMASERKFWKKQFADLPPILPLLPTAILKTRQPLRVYGIHRRSAKLESRVTAMIKATSKAQKVSTFHFYLATYRALLCRLAEVDDICIGMADSNRMGHPDDIGVLGVLLNLLPLRFNAYGNQEQPTFATLLKEARARAFGALSHSSLPFNVILEDSNVERTSLHSPLFQAFIEYRAANPVNKDFENEQPEDATSYSKTAYDVILNVLEDHAGETTISFGVQSMLYDEDTADALLRGFIQMLRVFARQPNSLLKDVSPYAQDDVDLALKLGSGQFVPPTWPETLIHRIDQMAERYGDSLALKDTTGQTMSYTEMTAKINGLATILQAAKASPGSIVGVFQSPSVSWICSALAVMRIGAVYLPLDLRQGKERLTKIVQICSPAIILTDSSTDEGSAVFRGKTINVDEVAPKEGSPSGVVAMGATSAAILFTSGTTGLPKGIVLQHSGLRNAVEGLTFRFDLKREVVLQQTAFSFDMSLDEIFVALCNGGVLVVVEKGLRGDSRAIMDIVASHEITYTRATPPEYSSWIRHGGDLTRGRNESPWKFAFAGGDRMMDSLRKEFQSLNLPGLRLFNSYGPTEISLSAVKIETPYNDEEVLRNDQIPIGRPMDNYAVYIVGSNMQPLPIGIPGEILIGGAGVSKGYFGDAEQSAKYFQHNRWATDSFVEQGWDMVYRTGDRGYLNRDGAVVFEGRLAGDTQIKLRGNRIELGDIESNILRCSEGNLSSVVCTTRGVSESEFLVGHVVFSQSSVTPPKETAVYLRGLLASLPLPSYMKPAILVPLTSMPLTVHHKVDRATLAAMSVEHELDSMDPAGVESLLTSMERELGELWATVLPQTRAEACGPSSDFFALGGNSLLLVELLAHIRNTFGASMPLVELLEASTLRHMARKVEEVIAQNPIDWENETFPPPITDIACHNTHRRLEGLEVVVTGTTGHIGRHLLPQLIASDRIAKIHCIAVRSPENQTLLSDKLVIYRGDITSPLFGLTQTEKDQLFASADAVIHLAAVRSFWEPYQIVRKINFLPLKELVKMAAPRKIPIHFMSSGGVVLGQESTEPKSASSLVPLIDGSDGYLASKWAAERLLERCADQHGTPVHIYRTMPFKGKVGPLPKQIVDDFASAVLKTGAILNVQDDEWSGSFDLISANAISEALCESLSSLPQPEKVTYTHLDAIARVGSWEQFSVLLERPGIAERNELEKLSGPKWLGRIKRAGFEWAVASQDAKLGAQSHSRR